MNALYAATVYATAWNRIDEMAKQRLRALFFCAPNGEITIKAKPLSDRKRREIYEKYNGICTVCGAECSFYKRSNSSFIGRKPVANVDHILPRSRGGQNNETNLRLLCEYCNLSRGAAL